MAQVCSTEEIQSLFLSTLLDVVVTDMRQYLVQKYSEVTGEYIFNLEMPYSKLRLKTNWERGTLEGPAYLLWGDDSVAVEFFYRDFVPHGRATFYDNHMKIAAMTIMDGRYIGDCEIYRNGRLMYSGDYFHGDANGKGVMFYPSGSIMYEGEFRNGYADGKGTFYDPKGNDVFSDSWKRGRCKLIKTSILLPPLIVAIEQTHDEDVYTEEEFSRRITQAMAYLRTFESRENTSSDTSIKKRSPGLSDSSESRSSESIIPIARGQLTKHILEQQVVVRTSDEDFMNLPLANNPSKKVGSVSKKNNNTELSDMEKMQKQPSALYVQPAECPKPPDMKVNEKVVSVYTSDEWKEVSKQVTDMTIETECFNDEYIRYLKFNSFKLLQHLTINDFSCTTVNTFTVRNNQYLRSLQIGNDCFSTTNVRNASEYQYVLKALKKDIEGGSFFISMNYYLESIVIGKQSFLKFSRFALTLLPNLKVLIIGDITSYDDVNTGSFNFLGVSTLFIEKLPSLKKLIIGSYCFTEVRNVFIRDLPSLKHLELGHSVFRGDETWKQNSINFKKLPALEEVVMRDHVGKNIEFLNISDTFSSGAKVDFQIGAVFSNRIRVSHEGCPEDAINRFLDSII